MSQFKPLSTQPILIFGGPYSNLEATKALLAEAEQMKIPPANVLCTGDIVAYCASPQETIDLIRDWGISVVLGNCEESLGNDADDCGCGFEEGTTCEVLSAGWFDFSKPRISQSNKEWMKQLPRRITFAYSGFECEAIHGGTEHINQFIYASDREEIMQQLENTPSDIILGGHCGIPFGQQSGGKAWLNAGVIGMPANDGTQDGWYMLVTPVDTGIEISWHRLKYNAQTTVDMMQQKGLKTAYQSALLSGVWPSMDVLPDTEKAGSDQKLALSAFVIKKVLK
jgi:predicted phosphodiesterase